MRSFFNKRTKDDILIGHYISLFDLPVLERILGIKIKCKFVDTLALSWYLFPDRKRHGLEAWGEDFGIEKPKINDWSNLATKEYIHRCEEDTKINVRLWKNQWNKLVSIYKSDVQVWRFLDYLSFKMYCARLAEDSGWKVDVEYCEKNLISLITERDEKREILRSLMPKVPIVQKKQRPVQLVKKDGTRTKIAQSWYDLLKEQSLPDDTEDLDVTIGFNEPNPNSTPQIKDWLFSLGWVPTTFEEKKNKDGIVREIPKINLDFGKGICESIKVLYEKEPRLEVLDGLSILNHRIPMLRKFLTKRDSRDYVKASIQGLTNTLRFQHADPCVNMPKPEKRYAEAIRGCLIAPKGYKLVGADLVSLEDKLKQSYIYPLDPKYVQSMEDKEYDPHTQLAVSANLITQEEEDFYKWYQKKH